jgi:hypothetical protein
MITSALFIAALMSGSAPALTVQDRCARLVGQDWSELQDVPSNADSLMNMAHLNKQHVTLWYTDGHGRLMACSYVKNSDASLAGCGSSGTEFWRDRGHWVFKLSRVTICAD